MNYGWFIGSNRTCVSTYFCEIALMHYYCVNFDCPIFNTTLIAVQLSLADSDHRPIYQCFPSIHIWSIFVDCDGKLRSYLLLSGEFVHVSPVISIGIHTTGNIVWGWKISRLQHMPGLKEASDNRQGFSQLMWRMNERGYMCWHTCASPVFLSWGWWLSTRRWRETWAPSTPLINSAGLKLKPWASETITRPSSHTTYRTWLRSCSPCTEQTCRSSTWG